MFPISHQIYLRRLEQNLTQQELAHKAGIPQPNLSNIEKGKQDLTVSTLRKIAVALNISPKEFFEGNVADTKSTLSRNRIEAIARMVATQISSDDPEVALFQNLIPYKGRARVKELHQSWLELRKRFNPQEISSVYERVEEHRRRQA